MADVKEAWTETGERLSGLGRRLRTNYEAERASGEGPSTGEQLKEAVRKFGDALEDVVEAIGKSAKDPAVKDDVKQVGQSLAGALGVTFAEISEELRKAFAGSRAGRSADGAEAEAASDAPAAAETVVVVEPVEPVVPPAPEEPTSPNLAKGDGPTNPA